MENCYGFVCIQNFLSTLEHDKNIPGWNVNSPRLLLLSQFLCQLLSSIDNEKRKEHLIFFIFKNNQSHQKQLIISFFKISTKFCSHTLSNDRKYLFKCVWLFPKEAFQQTWPFIALVQLITQDGLERQIVYFDCTCQIVRGF